MAERTIVLVGPTGAGKSAVGAALARVLGVRFLDSDQALAAALGPVPELYRSLGEEAFRRAEASTVASLLADPGRAVLSLGGGAVLDGGTRRLLAAGTVVWLDTDLATVLPRIEGGRPLFGGDVAEAWQRNYDRRRPLYEEVASLRIDARTGTPEELAAEIAAGLRDRA
ncbi:shikimate kinase [Sinomonas atrocyanea]|uniref:shikimate kinase n=1 Tax=Sinomonas atrocyanea TaxID=37927 RepID=UPI00278A6FA1|nr:shikimate kinase [Sinomonas atrocyanea]MDP9883135.1 shikimate kinase [Sinomonas atrocyanea]